MSVTIRLAEVDFSKAPLFRGAGTIPANAVSFAENGDAVISPQNKWERRNTVIPKAEFSDRFERNNKHFRERHMVRAFYIGAEAHGDLNGMDELRVSLPGILNVLHPNHYLLWSLYGIYYDHDAAGIYRKWDDTGVIKTMNASRFEATFSRTAEDGKIVSLSENFERQAKLLGQKRWEGHLATLRARQDYERLSMGRILFSGPVSRSAQEVLFPNPFESLEQ